MCLLRATDWVCNVMKVDRKIWLNSAEIPRFDTGGIKGDKIIIIIIIIIIMIIIIPR